MDSSVVPLFVCGCPRSGTTALARLLNLHPEIVVGLERYKGIYGPERRIDPAMFDEPAFFEFAPGQTNFAPGGKKDADRFYEEARRKYRTARFVGDKYPQFYRFYDRLFAAFPRARVVFIVRDPLAVAQSWQRRSEAAVNWPAKNDARRSIGYWNDALAYTLAYIRARPEAFWLVEYEELFRTGQPELDRIFRGIGADAAPEVLERIARAAQPSFDDADWILARPIELPPEVVADVRAGAAQPLYEQMRELVRAQG